MSQQSLSGALEELVLTSLCWDTELATVIAMKVTPDLFGTRSYRVIAKAAIDHVIRFSEAPRNHLADILEKELDKGEQGTQLWNQIGRMEGLKDEIQRDYVLAELDQWVETHKLYNALKEALLLTEKGESTKAREIIFSANLETESDTGIWMNDTDSALSFLDKEDEEHDFNTGIEALDSRGIRPARKTLFVVMAPKKRGKSMGLVHIAKEACFLNRKSVLFISLEMSAEKVAKRFVQSICGWTSSETDERTLRVPMFRRDERGNYLGMDFDVLTPQALSRATRKDAAKRLTDLSRGKRRLLIKEFPTGTLTTPRLIMFLEYLKRSERWEPDMIIVDYANLMSINSAQVRTETGRVFRDLRGIAMDRNIAMVTATQGNRSSETARVVGSTHVSEDWSVMGTADTVITICRTPEEKDRRLARLFVAAARDAPDQYLVMISQAFETCQFATDSIYMNKVADRDFERLVKGDEGDDD